MSNALKKINARVKVLQKKHPRSKRTALQKQAGREYRAGKLGGTKKKKHVRRAPSRRVASVKKRTHRKRVGATNKSHTDGLDKKRVDITIGSVERHVSIARKQLTEQIGWGEAAKLNAKTAKSKRDLQKKINVKKHKLRKLNSL